jgi:rhomboid family GlyGly-CTERM serine protease
MDFAALIYHRQAFLDGQWWLPFTSQLVHFNVAHAMINLAGAVLLYLFFRPWLRGSAPWLGLLGGWAAVAVVVVVDANCSYYAGASGALQGCAAGGALAMCRASGSSWIRSRWLGLMLLVFLFLKMCLLPQMTAGDLLWGVPVYQPAHWAGTLGGLLMVLVGAAGNAGLPSERTDSQRSQH